MRYVSLGIVGGIAGALVAGYAKPSGSSTLVFIAVGLLLGLLVAWAIAPKGKLPFEDDLREGGPTNVTAFAMRIGRPEATARVVLNALVTAGVATCDNGTYQIKSKVR